MIELIIIVLSLIAIGVIIMLIRGAGKQFKPKLSHRERAKLEQNIETEIKVKETEQENEAQSAPVLKSQPQRDLKDEINRFKTYFDIENDKLTKSIRDGIAKFVSGNFKEAVADFSTAIDMNPAEPVGHYCRAITKLRLRNYESSIQDFTESIRLQMNDLNSLYYRGVAKYHSKDLSGALLDLTSFSKTAPEFAEAYYILGLVYKETNKFDDAVLYFSNAISKNSRHESALFERGLIKDKLGDKTGCCADLKKAYELGHLESYHYIKELCN